MTFTVRDLKSLIIELWKSILEIIISSLKSTFTFHVVCKVKGDQGQRLCFFRKLGNSQHLRHIIRNVNNIKCKWHFKSNGSIFSLTEKKIHVIFYLHCSAELYTLLTPQPQSSAFLTVCFTRSLTEVSVWHLQKWHESLSLCPFRRCGKFFKAGNAEETTSFLN